MKLEKRVLFLEDSKNDFELILDEVKKVYPKVIYKYVDNKNDFMKKLEEFKPDIVVTDYSLPSISGMEVIELIQKKYTGIPVIVVTGAVDEETAVECMKAGAVDYVLKDNLLRLNPAIKSAFQRIELQWEKEKALNKLKENEKYYRTLLNQIHEDVIVIDRDYMITDINNSMLNSTGQHRSDIIGKPCYQVSHGYNVPCNEEGEICPLLEVFKSGKSISVLHEHLNAEGNKTWVDLLFSPVKDESDKTVRVIESARNVSDIYQLQDAVRKSEKLYKDLVENAGVGILIEDNKGKITFFNDDVIQIFGFKNRLLKNKSLKNIFHPDDYKQLKKKEAASKEISDVKHTYDLRGKKQDGSEIFLQVTAVKMYENETVTGTRYYIHNITEAKHQQQALSESEEKYRLIVENAHDGIEITQDDKIIFANARFAEMIGYEMDELLNMPIYDFFTDDAKQALLKRQQIRQLKIEAPRHYETTFIKKDGSIIDVDVKYEITNYKQQPATFAIIQDITERKRTERELKKRYAELERFQEVTVGREFKIIELKKEINELLAKLNQESKYEIPV